MVVNACRMIARLMMILLGALLLNGCRVADVRTFEIQVPKMVNQACADVVQKAVVTILPEPDAVKIDLERRVVMATYNSLIMSRKNIEFVIADAGFEANGVPANKDAESKLPEACRPAVAAPASVTP